ncbi:NAD(P)-binding protein [Aaosphaeria arxii CBS 175.79]|uniref:NAD(P)-binding protein n=1 Tax=Aaosphaeria arxii CBS 175.79 TaxID=1450172 RepID=A0A6A5XQD5_9PLEO|nr:NAD(P)-binding protein [Aaosphaeria arxii CBS 175.79]KAF2015099.1 NAD(P)-binding protein [Aaosphaeria arxii CBS 175.79]
MAPIPFGVIGTGWITDSYIVGAHATGEWLFSAVSSRSAETGKKFAAKYASANPNINVHTSVEDIAADPSITTVYIASPNSLHYSQAKTVLSAGKHVILEKPATANLKQLEELFALAYSKNLILIEAYRHVQEANFKILKSAISTKLGAILGARLDFCQLSSKYNDVIAGRQPQVFSRQYAAGSLVDLGVYNVSAAVDLFGSPDKVDYVPYILPQTDGADGSGNLLLKYPTFPVNLTISKIFTSTAPAVEIYGEKGVLVAPTLTDIESVTFIPSGKNTTREELAGPKEPAELNLKEEAADHARIIQTADWEGVKKWEALSRGVVKITEAARRQNGIVFPGQEFEG